ncbi:MAG: hypothetical protein JWR13_748, partial [Mycobacterium sp.]|nr:hypothetical protein [Mycobacterium sp.]
MLTVTITARKDDMTTALDVEEALLVETVRDFID